MSIIIFLKFGYRGYRTHYLPMCMDKGEDGELKMTITIPDESVLDNLAKSLARMASG